MKKKRQDSLWYIFIKKKLEEKLFEELKNKSDIIIENHKGEILKYEKERDYLKKENEDLNQRLKEKEDNYNNSLLHIKGLNNDLLNKNNDNHFLINKLSELENEVKKLK